MSIDGTDPTQIERAREVVAAAFAARPYPGDVHIVGPAPMRGEAKQVFDFFRGKAWSTITLRSLLDEYVGDPRACLSFMCPEGFQYYLPAFLLCSLDPDRETGLDLAASVAAILTMPAAQTGRRESFLARATGFAPSEREAIRTVLHCLDHEWAQEGWNMDDFPNPAREALGSFWEGPHGAQ